MKLDPEKYRDLAGFLLKTRPDEMTCDEWIDRVGEYSERILAGQPIPSRLDEVVRHIDLCPECAEEFQAILTALREVE
jgi:hypothetical protein